MTVKTQTYDVIVVGAGLSGLIAGAALSKEGLRVLLLEKMDTVGGRMRHVRQGDYTIPIGMHGFRRVNMDKAMERCGVAGPLYLTGSLGFYNIQKAKVFELTGSPEDKLATYMEGLGLTQEDVTAMGSAYESTRDPKSYQGKSFTQWLDDLGLSPRMKKILNELRNWQTDRAIPDPEMLSMDTYASALLPFFYDEIPIFTLDQSLLDGFATAIRQNGGEVKTGTEVKTLSIDNGRVTGVIARDMLDDNWIVYRAPRTIVNVPIFHALQWGLIKEKDFPADWVKVSKEIQPYAGAFAYNWYGLRERVVEHNTWVYFLDEEPETKTYVVDVGSTSALSNHVPTFCPPDRQLVYVTAHLSVDEVKDPNTWPQKVEYGHQLLRDYFKEMGYPPLEEVLEFRNIRYQVPSWDTHIFTHYWKDMPEFRAPSIEGLYFTGSTVRPAVGCLGVDNVIVLGMRCADVVLADR